METLIFDRPWIVQLLIFLGVAILGLGVGNTVLVLLQRRFSRDGRDVPVAAALMSIATVFALFLGFLAADIWDQKQWATDGAAEEHAALQRYAVMVGPGGLDDMPALSAVTAYVDAVMEEEWGQGRNRHPSAKAQAGLAEIWRHSLRLAEDRPEAPVAHHLLLVVDDIHDAREARLAIGRGHGQVNAWLTVLMLAIFSYVALAVAHLDRPRAGRVAMLTFAIATTTVFMFLALHDSPYSGGVRLEPDLIALRD